MKNTVTIQQEKLLAEKEEKLQKEQKELHKKEKQWKYNLDIIHYKYFQKLIKNK